MSRFFGNIKGDKAIWAVVALLALFSFLPVYSASSNLVYVVGNGTTMGHLLKHALLLFLGFGIIYGVHKIPTHYFKGLSIIALPVVILLLVYTLTQGTTIEGANASRWIRLPFVGITFQTSNLAAVVLMIYTARYLTKIKDRKIRFSESIVPLWLPAALLFAMILTLCFLGGYPLKYLGAIILAGIATLALFVLLAKALPGVFPNRVDT